MKSKEHKDHEANDLARTLRERLVELEARDVLDTIFTHDEIDDEFEALRLSRPDLDRVHISGQSINLLVEAKSSQAREIWQNLKDRLSWFRISLESIPAHSTAATGHRSAEAERHGAPDIPEGFPEALFWVPVERRELSSRRVQITFFWAGGDAPKNPSIDLRKDGQPVSPEKVIIGPDDLVMMIRLPVMSKGEYLELSAEDSERLIVNIASD